MPQLDGPGLDQARRRQLGVVAAAVLLTATDTYVVVVVLPSIMTGVGLGVDALLRAAPIISAFLLGYVAVLPLLGRLTDLVGARPVMAACLAIFSLGSLLTATAHALPIVVVGRALQGVGGGGLLPVALTLVGAGWAETRRGLPLGVLGAVQELGSVLGPLYGAAVVELGSWRAIFWVNLPLTLLLGVLFASSDTPVGIKRPAIPARRTVVEIGVLGVGGGLVILGLVAPSSLAEQVTLGQAFTPLVGGASWTDISDPLTVCGAVLVVIAVISNLRRTTARCRAELGGTGGIARRADLPGAGMLAVILGCVVGAFSTADPGHQLVSSDTPELTVVAAIAAVGLVVRQRRAANPLLEPALLVNRSAAGALGVNLLIGAGLIAALVDVPLFARVTINGTSQVGAALVLVRFLVAVPVGALAGGLLCRRGLRNGWIAAAGATLASIAFATMTTWRADALTTPLLGSGRSLGIDASDLALVACGLGFGLIIAPVNAAVLAAVPEGLHGLASSLAVVARTIGMMVGLSVLTAVALRRFDQAEQAIGSPLTLCPANPGQCPAYDRATAVALLRELHTIFGGAACCTAAAAVLAATAMRSNRTRKSPSPILAG